MKREIPVTLESFISCSKVEIGTNVVILLR